MKDKTSLAVSPLVITNKFIDNGLPMKRQEFEDRFHLNFDLIDVLISNKSALDANSFLSEVKNETSGRKFIEGYGVNIEDPVEMAELFGNFQEALQFIRKYFLKEGRVEGLDFRIPERISQITDIKKLLELSTSHAKVAEEIELSHWAGIVLKVMHTILHVDKDLRQNYFNTIQTQIFDRYYKFLHRDWKNKLFLKSSSGRMEIPIKEFQTKSKKSRDSVLIKLLHKKENVAEELFDRVGIRFITYSKYDALRVLKFLYDEFIIVPHNVKPSRSQNSLISLDAFKSEYMKVYKEIRRKNLSGRQVNHLFEKIADNCLLETKKTKENQHSQYGYSAIHFTCRQLIRYNNPFYKDFYELRKQARKEPRSPLVDQLLKVDISNVRKTIKFFYPYEIQITDYKSHKQNTLGEASHKEYKKSQVYSAMVRLFRPLLEFKNIEIY
jgi:uncharacterized protein (TIGR04562 family)